MIQLFKISETKVKENHNVFKILFCVIICLNLFSNLFASNLDSLKHILNTTNEPTEKLAILLDLSNAIEETDSDSSLFYLNKAIDISDSVLANTDDEKIEKLKLKALIKAGKLLRLQAKYIEAKDYFNKALKIAKKTGDSEQEGMVYAGMGIIFRQQGSYHNALEYELRALKIAESLRDSTWLAGLYNNLGVVYINMNNYKEALNSFSKALEIVEKSKVYYPNVELLNIGNIYKIQKDYTKALQYVQKSLEISENTGAKQRIAECNYTIGDIYLMQDSTGLARKYFFDALQIFSNLNYNYGSDECYTKIGESYKKEQEYRKALKYYQKALKIAKTQNDKETQSYILHEIADLYLNLKQYDKAEKYAIESLNIAEKEYFLNTMNAAYKILAHCFENKGDYKSSLYYLKKYNESKDSIFTQEKYKAVLETEAKYENLKKDMELSLLQKEKDVFKEKAKKNRILNITTGIISILLLILLLLGYFYSRQKERTMKIEVEKEKTQMKLEYDKKLMELRLITLKNQLNPHFIFNTLNSIGSVILKADKEKAYDLFTKFTALIRHTIENSDNIAISLNEELEQIEKYLYLQKFRFKNKFDYSIEIDENVDLNIPVPRMFIEIFVENAIKHGLKHKQSEGYLKIKISQKKNTIVISIVDNGIGRKKAAESTSFGTGRGIKIAREMFDLYEQLHKNKAEFEIEDLYDENGIASGTKVIEKIVLS